MPLLLTVAPPSPPADPAPQAVAEGTSLQKLELASARSALDAQWNELPLLLKPEAHPRLPPEVPDGAPTPPQRRGTGTWDTSMH